MPYGCRLMPRRPGCSPTPRLQPGITVENGDSDWAPYPRGGPGRASSFTQAQLHQMGEWPSKWETSLCLPFSNFQINLNTHTHTHLQQPPPKPKQQNPVLKLRITFLNSYNQHPGITLERHCQPWAHLTVSPQNRLSSQARMWRLHTPHSHVTDLPLVEKSWEQTQ